MKKKVEYFVNQEKRTVICKFTAKDKKGYNLYEDIIVYGKAKCSPEDQWNEDRGMAIAYSRAMINLKKKIRDLKINIISEIENRIEGLKKLQEKLFWGTERNNKEIISWEEQVKRLSHIN